MKRDRETIAKNRKATHEYEILETYEAGIELKGCEVRSLRENHCQMTDCFALIRDGECWLHNVHIAPYSHGNIARSAFCTRRGTRRAWRSCRWRCTSTRTAA